jgi:High potential iron-sulfur protein
MNAFSGFGLSSKKFFPDIQFCIPTISNALLNNKIIQMSKAVAGRRMFLMQAASQARTKCVLFQGRLGVAVGAGLLSAGEHVSANGWCSAYAEKAA